ncbi:uncharacterized protein FIBRA_05809 [Fibroporia radiculosa]|uniref:Uncharacterized protein n=1 Tax=Fibroporia radiculosa TaxID=599839 RepID=J4GRN2_9APHY|nr:uncharacterized protein FIBRA_05809 [Fibroporia radiculosa]CCM03665.1 predicted protein [Fibroporia radiculosa]
MSANSAANIVVPQPINKGSPWSSLRGHERVSTPPAYASDPKYKKYAQQVEKCLNSFDSVHEWADFISFLKQLLKTFEAYTQFKEIPRKLIVAKRLSQCLNPALPTGVHQRALDVYSHVFAVLGTEGLHRDLALWSSGLFPFFEYAATSVKPTLLNLFDTYYLPLQVDLRPIMKSFILALLPGLEEDTGEYFDKVLGLLDRISGAVSQSFFFQNIWLVMLTTPSARGTSLNFLSRRLPTLKANEGKAIDIELRLRCQRFDSYRWTADITFIVGRDVGLMIRAFSSALEDEDLLVRRSALDLLLQSLRLDGTAVGYAQPEDRVILMRASSSVVLRRDLSLNRRLYSWLLGPEENNQRQIEYLRANALELLRSSLREEMFNPSIDYSPSRPFKIFISLLDKWEIGSLLTEVLIYDAFKAIRKALESGLDVGDDMNMTAHTLYEAVEPHILWKILFSSVYHDLISESSNSEGLSMVKYILTTFHGQDQEIETVHLPIVFTATVETLLVRLSDSSAPLSKTSAQTVLLLQGEILRRIPHTTSLHDRPHFSDGVYLTSASQGPSSFACAVYGVPAVLKARSRNSTSAPFATSFEDLVDLINFSAISFLKSTDNSELDRDILIQALALLDDLITRPDFTQGSPVLLAWDSTEWLSNLLQCLNAEATTFSLVDAVVSVAIKVQNATVLESKLLNHRKSVSIMTNALLKYLRLTWAAYHARVVSLMWSLDQISHGRQVEAVLSQRLSSCDPKNVEDACEEFGVLWRLTDDDIVPGSRLKVPMMIVLDTLKSADPTLRRVGETWMRCSLKSYLRVLDPILHDLFTPSILRSPSIKEVDGKQLQGFSYDCPFDQRYINHVLETLLSVVKFGGQGFSKTARTTAMNRSPYAELLQRLQNVDATFVDATYMDVLLHLLLLFLQSEPKPTLVEAMGPFNTMAQSLSIDVLQALVARGEVDFPALQTIESIVVRKLYTSVHDGRLDLQNKLLHLLHSVISASHSNLDGSSSKGRSVRPARNIETTPLTGDGQGPKAESYAIHSLLVPSLLDGISRFTNRPVMQHWLDFILMTIPQFQETMQPVIIPLCEGICRQLRISVREVQQASADGLTSRDVVSITTDADFIMLLTALERLVLLTLSHVSDPNPVDDELPSDKPNQESSGLLGYVSNVFSSDTSAGPEEQPQTRMSDYKSLYDAVGVLYALWDLLSERNQTLWPFSVYGKTRGRCRKVLEHLFRAHAPEVIESVVAHWQSATPEDLAAFEIHIDSDDLSVGAAQKIDDHPSLRLEGPLAAQVWGRFVLLAKDVSASMREFRLQVFSTLRCFTILADKLSQTTSVDDRRLRKELQETYSKLLDLCTLASRPYDQGSWIRRPQREILAGNGRESPLTRVVSDTKLDEKMNSSSTSLPDSVKPSYGTDAVEKVNLYIASSVVPNLRKFLSEGDKILAVCNTIVYNIVSPTLKSKTRPLNVEDNVLCILQEMTRIGAAIKAWRGPVTDAFNDNRCFNSTPDAGGKWRVMIKSLFDTDKTSLSELLGKITTAPSANIFTNREYEMLLRSLNLRRLSYALLSGEKNHFLTQLPSIQEKLVDTLRNVSAPIVQSEVYLCVRVLLCRLSPHNLSSFWPVILTELYRLFDQALTSLPSDGSEELGLILAACKLLDLLLVLQTEEFQIYQWIFITDTVDAVYRPDDWFPDAMLDRLAEVTGSLPIAEDTTNGPQGRPSTPVADGRPMRRPMLRALRQIDSIRDLIPFFSGASIASYESVYSSGGNIDWEAVEQGLLEDMFDGR